MFHQKTDDNMITTELLFKGHYNINNVEDGTNYFKLLTAGINC